METEVIKEEKIAVLGLGYVGLPVAIALAKKIPGIVGFDIHEAKITELQSGKDRNEQFIADEISRAGIKFTSKLDDLKGASFIIITVPTPVDPLNRPDLSPLIEASRSVGKIIQKGAVVVYESTVYPGVTEEICGKVIEDVSGLKRGQDFKVGYSPERINPGDKEHTFEKIIKVVSGEDEETLTRISSVYSTIVEAGIFKAASIKVAEAAKVIENIQRDINIALMNELAIIFDKLDISTAQVLEAAGTKWNFLPFKPGLVGGHCIGVDPYYLTSKAEEVGYHPQVILSGRRINDSMGEFIAQKLVKLLIKSGSVVRGCRVGIMGLTFKENVPDLRNSRVPDIIHELEEYEIQTIVYDPLVDANNFKSDSIHLVEETDFNGFQALILAVTHDAFFTEGILENQIKKLNSGGVLIDVKSAINPHNLPDDITYWSL